MFRVNGPLEEVLKKPATTVEELLKVRSWEVKESPADLGYVAVHGWPKLPRNWRFEGTPRTYVAVGVCGAAADSKGRYYVAHRGGGMPPILRFDRDGELCKAWGEGEFGTIHYIKCGPNDNLWVIDTDSVYCYTPEGKLIKRIGTKGELGEDGTHFHEPTDVAFGKDGRIYVSDGYGNQRVAYFEDVRGHLIFPTTPKFLGQWGSKGDGEGQFHIPHSITTDAEGLVYVSDRQRWRIEIFTPDGEFLRQWTHIGRVYQLDSAGDHIYAFTHHGRAPNAETRLYKIDLSGEIVGWIKPNKYSLESAHGFGIAPNGDIVLTAWGPQLYIKK